MTTDRAICVTGMGIVSALGNGVEATLSALLAERSGVGAMQLLQSAHNDLPVGEVRMTDDQLRDELNIAPHKVFTRTALLGTLALDQALRQTHIGGDRSDRIAFVSGTTVGGMEKSEQYYRDFLSNDSRNDYIRSHDCGATTEAQADYFGLFDMATTISTACSSAANAVIFASELIRSGRYDCVVAGGSECLTRFHLNGFNTLMILDRQPCRPFDATRAGLNLGEGAAYLVLETERSARARGAKMLARLAGVGNSCDAYHQTASSPNGEGALRAMQKALTDANLKPEAIDYINAHGTGTVNNDLSEGRAIDTLFGECGVPPVSSTKAFTGHTTSASGSIEAVISILALLNDFTPVNLNFGERMEELSFVPVTDSRPRGKMNTVMTNSFGFGGNDSSLIFTRI